MRLLIDLQERVGRARETPTLKLHFYGGILYPFGVY